MTTDAVTFFADCPSCGLLCTWRQLRDKAPFLRLQCSRCGDSDPVAYLASVIKGGVA